MHIGDMRQRVSLGPLGPHNPFWIRTVLPMNELSLTSTPRRINRERYPKCKLSDGNKRKPSRNGNVCFSHCIYPTTRIFRNKNH